ncbi:ankyrin repeat domain-containing protein 33B-like [Onthophagus taurus]|uniref:ankyrin repeat domain-containing protein 33B-like n=1 Tax=Onthophagus taurus TaxID=166361 RepID=UPI000C20E70B|nr:ankyrin repeat domain-containing protein 33B-like [Onthophagus taurus]XP_022903369.1 ankyrin repeat domain-containing protein 33B-like [Onthophagus taurus]
MKTLQSRNNHVRPCIKEVTYIAVVPNPSRFINRRIAELPSLRYGSLGSKSPVSGPLRLSNKVVNSETFPRTTKKISLKNECQEVDKFGVNKNHRRVRFTLPPAEGANKTRSNTFSESLKRVAAGDQQLKYRSGASSRSAEARGVRLNSIQSERSTYNTRREVKEVRKEPKGNGSCCLASLETDYEDDDEEILATCVPVSVTASPAVRTRIHPTGRYVRGTLSPTANTAAPVAPNPGGQLLLRAARDGEEGLLRDILRRAALVGIADADINGTDNSGRTALSYIASNGSVEILDQILQLPNLDPNISDNEGNTPLHFAAQAGQVECLNCMLTRCRGIEIDSRNNLGFTPLMKAALQGRNKCAKLLLFAGANPTLRDNGRGLRADQWARFCGRYVCADVIEKLARQRLLERSTSYGNWGIENEMGARILLGKVVPVPQIPQQSSHGIKSKLRKVFRTSSGPGQNDHVSSARLVTQLTSAALCASTPVLPSAPTVPPVVKSLIRPLTVPRLQITLVNNNNEIINSNLTNGLSKSQTNVTDDSIIKPARTKKKK